MIGKDAPATPPHVALLALTAGSTIGVIGWIVFLVLVYSMFKLGGW